MSIVELIKTVQFVVDSHGNKKAVQLDLEVWEELVLLLEDLEDVDDIKQVAQDDDELIPWEQVVSDYKTIHPNADV